MNDTIPWYQSKAVWGSLLAIVSPIVGVTIPVEEASTLIATAGSVIGGALALYGRLVAKSVITSGK